MSIYGAEGTPLASVLVSNNKYDMSGSTLLGFRMFRAILESVFHNLLMTLKNQYTINTQYPLQLMVGLK